MRLSRAPFLLCLVFIAGFTTARAQVATGGNYTLEQSVIAGGGGQNSTGGAFTLDGTVGQPAAGARLTASPFAVTSGFWTGAAFNPTAAEVSIAGRVLTPDGRGLKNALVSLTDTGGRTRTVITGAFGYYRFAEIEVGQTYVFAVVSKRYRFVPRIVTVIEELTELNFVPAPGVGSMANKPF